ncbi:helix-turn-helix domain-containing protein [Vineibacter terrae]|uniref:AraC family transcriptional regulator n=1 Tax=Vineibacter terrae TaxID=2586908 RepID=UPI002E37CE99|nr:helix-turn-helix domain-containing protein [Vineibacter terrae]HEX2887327.1 helix-turn-helix domain-containing protein [Vineibacter terrae]
MDGHISSPLAARRRVAGPQEAVAQGPERLTLQGFSRGALDGSMLGGTIGRHMQLGPGRLTASIDRLRFKETALRKTSFSTAVRAVIGTPADVVTLGFAVEAPEPFVIAGERLPVGTMTVFGPGSVNDVRYPAGVTAITLAMPSALFSDEAAAISRLEPLRFPGRYPVGQAEGHPLRQLRDAAATIGQLDIDCPRLLNDSQWRANAERALLDAFFGVLAATAPIAATPPDRLRSARAIILEADARMDADPMSIPTIPRLCSALRVSRRTLERAFQDMLNMSPAHYLRVRALNATREQLLRSQPLPGMITRIAIDNGFWHMGRFSLSYRALFGERPIDTLHRTNSRRAGASRTGGFGAPDPIAKASVHTGHAQEGAT